jgi:hypothetical protein
MPNDAIAQLISKHFPLGLPHPGDLARKQPPILIQLPAFRTAGMQPELAKRVTNTLKLVGEAIVNLVETVGDSEIVSKKELAQLRAPKPGEPTPVLCRNCRSPMLWLNIVNGRATVTPELLSGVNIDCPHRIG